MNHAHFEEIMFGEFLRKIDYYIRFSILSVCSKPIYTAKAIEIRYFRQSILYVDNWDYGMLVSMNGGVGRR